MELTIVEKSWIPKSIWGIPLQAHLLLFDSNLSTNIAQFSSFMRKKNQIESQEPQFFEFSLFVLFNFQAPGLPKLMKSSGGQKKRGQKIFKQL